MFGLFAFVPFEKKDDNDYNQKNCHNDDDNEYDMTLWRLFATFCIWINIIALEAFLTFILFLTFCTALHKRSTAQAFCLVYE